MAIPWAAIGNAASAIGSVTSLFGGSKENTGLINANNAKQLDLAEMSLRDPIKLRVRDAREAGIHPLYALGMSANAYQPALMQPQGYSGSDYGSSLQGMGQSLSQLQTPSMTAEQRAIHEATLRQMEASANRDNAQAQLFASEAAREAQRRNQTAPQPTTFSAKGKAIPDQIQGQPDQVKSHKRLNPSATAGNHPGYNDIVVISPTGKETRIALPDQDKWGDNELLNLGGFIYENLRRFGADLGSSVYDFNQRYKSKLRAMKNHPRNTLRKGGK